MDYDENEFQDQNCHVGGEGSSKFSPVLHPYALSKFDFEDGVQGHLRFDSLVENEVFLGIQSQEDNQWIEDFSRRSGVFSSSAPEPSPILRSNNVWFEAASSESVEMLLNSVGQEETDTIAEGPDACQKLNCVAEEMESHSDPNLPEKVTDLGSGMIDVEGTNCPVVETTTKEKSHMLNPSFLSEPRVIYGDDGGLDGMDCEKNVFEVDTSDKFSENEMHDPSGSNMHTEDKDSHSQDDTVNTGGMVNQETVTRLTDAGFDCANSLLTDDVKEVKEDNVVSKEVYVDDQLLEETANKNLKNLFSSSSNSGIFGLDPAKSSVSKLDKTSSFTVIRSVELHIAEECDENVHASELNKVTECVHVDLSDMTQIHQQFDRDIQDNLPKKFQGDGNIVAHVVEVSTEKAEITSGLKVKVCPTMEVTNTPEDGKVLMQGSDCQLGTEVSISDNHELSSLNQKKSETQGDGSSIIFAVENTIRPLTCFSVPLQEGEHSIKKSDTAENAASVHKGLNVEDSVTSPTVFGFASDLNSVDHDLVVVSNEEDKPVYRYDFNEMDCVVIKPFNHDKEVGRSFNGGSSIDPEASPLLYERDAHVGFAAGENSATGTVGSVGTNLTPLKDTLQSTVKMDLVLEIEKVLASNPTEELSREASCSPVGVTLNTASESEQTVAIMNLTAGQLSPMAEISNSGIQTVEAKKDLRNSKSSSNNLELFPNIYDPTSKQNSDVDASDSPAKAGGQDHRLAPSEVSDSYLSTPTTGSCNVLKTSNGEKEEKVEKSVVKSFPPGGSVESAFKEARLSDIAKDDRSFSFDPSSGVVGEYGQDMQFLLTTPSSKSSKVASSSTPSVGTIEPKILLESPRVRSQALDLEIALGDLTDTPARKRGRRPSDKAPGKQERRNSLKERTPSKQSEGGNYKTNVSTSVSGTGRLQFEEVKLHEKLEQSSVVSCSAVPVVTPILPDLNTSASPSALFRKPFSDIQQIQLRAQIFVYGSLIQGAAPDEACMVAAFGTSDGGRTMWEPVWRAFGEKLQGAKSNVSKSENPLQLQSGFDPPKQSSTKTDSCKNNVLPSPVARASSKGTPSPVVNSMIPLSSPLWNISTPSHGPQSSGMPRSSVFDHHQTLSPSYPVQTPPSRNVAGNNSSSHSHASFPAPWVNVSQSSPFDGRTRLPITESAKLTPIKEPVPPIASGSKYSFPSDTVHHSGPSVSAETPPLPNLKNPTLPFLDSGAKHSFPSSTVHSSGPVISAEPYPLLDLRKRALPSSQKTAEPKSRKRKKSTASENLKQIPLLAQAQTESVPAVVPLFAQARKELVPAPVIPSHFSTSVVVSTPSFFGSKGNEAVSTPFFGSKGNEVVSTPFFGSKGNEVVSTTPFFGSKGNEVVSTTPFFGSKGNEVVSTPFLGSKGNDARIVATASLSYSSDQPKRIEPNTDQKTNIPEDASVKAEAARKQAEDAAGLATAAVSHSQTIWDQMNKQKNFGLIPEVEARLAFTVVAEASAAVAKAAASAAQVALNAASQAKMMADEAWISSRVDDPAFISNIGNSMGLSITSPSIPKVGDDGNFSSSVLVAAKEAAKKRVKDASFASKRAENLDAIVKAAELVASAVSQVGRIVAMGDPPSLAKLAEAGPEGYWRAPQIIPQQPSDECSNVDSIQAAPNVSGGLANDEPSQKKAKTAERGMSPLSREVFKGSVDGMFSFLSSEKDSRAKRDSRASDLDKTIGVVPESESGSRPTCITAQDDYNMGIQTLQGTSIEEGSVVEVKKEGNGFKEAWFSAIVLSIENGKAFVSYAVSKSVSAQLNEWVPLEGASKIAPRIRLLPPVTNVQHEGTKKRSREAIGDYVWSLGDKVDARVKECWREGVVTDKNKIDNAIISVHFPAEGETSVVRAWHLRPTLIWKDGEWIESSSSRQRDPSHEGDTPHQKRLKLGGPSIEESEKDDLSTTFQLPGPGRPEELQLLPLSDNEKKFDVGNNIRKENKLEAPRPVRSGPQKERSRVVFGVPKPGKTNKFIEVNKHYGPESSSKTDKVNEKYMMPRNDAKEKQQGNLMTRVPKPVKPVCSFGRTLSQKDKFPSSAIATKNEAKKSTTTDGSESGQQKRSELDRTAQGSFVFSSSALSRNTFTSNARRERAKRGNQAQTVSKSTKEAKDNLAAGKHIPETAETRRSNRRIQPTARLLEGLQSSLILPPSSAHDKVQRSQNRSTPKGK